MTLKEKHDPKDAALSIISRLRRAEHVALLAGGCVRDMLLGVEPKDYDVATDAAPEQVKKLFPRARKVGAKFGVMLVRKLGHSVEVATFRTDGTYSDGRRPDEVTFGNQEDDARRRDFTINGMFFDPVGDEVIDLVGGRADLQAGIIRTIGEPQRRFAEDHLRMLRAVRFAARFGFLIDRATMQAIKRLAHKLSIISEERIWMELGQIITSPTRAAGWSLLVESGLRMHICEVWDHLDDEEEGIPPRLSALPPSPIDESLALASLLHDRPPARAGRICRSLKMSNEVRRAVAWLVASLPVIREVDSLENADLKSLAADGQWGNLIELLRVDELARTGSSEVYARVCARVAAIPPDALSPPPLLTGHDLIALGVAGSPRFGRILDAVYRAQLNGEIATVEEATDMARSLIQQEE